MHMQIYTHSKNYLQKEAYGHQEATWIKTHRMPGSIISKFDGLVLLIIRNGQVCVREPNTTQTPHPDSLPLS